MEIKSSLFSTELLLNVLSNVAENVITDVRTEYKLSTLICLQDLRAS
jgi:hypothetical protein